MGRLTRRLRYLEERARPWGTTREQLLLDRALSQMEPEDVEVLGHYLDRGGEERAVPTEEEAEVLSRLEEHLNEQYQVWPSARGKYFSYPRGEDRNPM